jgi:hypothetical protein
MCMLAAKRWWAWSRPRGEGIEQNQRNNPIRSKLPMQHSLRCGARTRSVDLPASVLARADEVIE